MLRPSEVYRIVPDHRFSACSDIPVEQAQCWQRDAFFMLHGTGQTA